MFSYRGHFLTGSSKVQNIMVEVQSHGEDDVPDGVPHHGDDGVYYQGEEVVPHQGEDVVPHHILYVDTEYSEVCVVCGDKASGE